MNGLNTPKYESMTRQQLANRAGVSVKTFKRWIVADRTEIEKFCTFNARVFPPIVVKYLCDKYCIGL